MFHDLVVFGLSVSWSVMLDMLVVDFGEVEDLCRDGRVEFVALVIVEFIGLRNYWGLSVQFDGWK